MSQYGPPGGPYPEQPQEPWTDQDAAQRYGAPADPWGTGQHEAWGGSPASTPPDGAAGSPTGYPSQAADAAPGYGGFPYADQGYQQALPEQGYRQAVPEQGYRQDAGQGYRQDAGQGYRQDPDQGYRGADPHQGYGGGPGYPAPHQGYGAAPEPSPGYRHDAETTTAPGVPRSGASGAGGYGSDYGRDVSSGYGSPPPPGPAAAPAWPPAPARRRPSVPLLALVASLVVVVFGALVATYVVLSQADGGPRATASAAAGAPAPSVPSTQEPSPSPAVSADARFVAIGQCVRNDGTESQPRMTIVPCGPKTYQVLVRFDGPTNGEPDAKSKCAKVGGYTNWYFFNSELDTLDFVLCLRLR